MLLAPQVARGLSAENNTVGLSELSSVIYPQLSILFDRWVIMELMFVVPSPESGGGVVLATRPLVNVMN